MFIVITNGNDILFGYRSQQQYCYVKGDQAYMCNLQS